MKHRKERMEQRLRDEVEKILQGELADDRLESVRVARIRCSGDLRQARVGLDIPDKSPAVRERVLEAAAGASGVIRRLLSDRISGRFVPDLLFHIDDSAKVLGILDSLGMNSDSEFETENKDANDDSSDASDDASDAESASAEEV
jgi:ribosome-binding factor A